jgi:hypothetical protein
MEYQHYISFLSEKRNGSVTLIEKHTKTTTKSLIQYNFVGFLLITAVSADRWFGVYYNAQIKALKWYDHKGYELSSQSANGQDAKYQLRTKIYF